MLSKLLARRVSVSTRQEILMVLENWVEKARSLGASALHLETDTSVVTRIRGDRQTVGGVVAV